jgi:predicted negative regulator of RcsB-dependent stress response
VDRHTRQELKSDKFVEEVGQTVHFLEEHRKQAFLYAGVALAVLVLAVGGYFFNRTRRAERQEAFYQAMVTFNATVTPEPQPNAPRKFTTPAEREAAVRKEFGDIIRKHSGSREAYASYYMLGVFAADQGLMSEAETNLRKAAESGDEEYRSLANLALADTLAASGRSADAEKLLRELMAKPTLTVTKEQAIFSLARVLGRSNPEAARKLIGPLRSQVGSVGRAAIMAYSAYDNK